MISNSQPLSKCPLYITSIFENERIGLKSYAKQAEAEVVPSSSLAEVEFEVEVGVEVEIGVLRCNLGLILVVVSNFTGGRVGGQKI